MCPAEQRRELNPPVAYSRPHPGMQSLVPAVLPGPGRTGGQRHTPEGQQDTPRCRLDAGPGARGPVPRPHARAPEAPPPSAGTSLEGAGPSLPACPCPRSDPGFSRLLFPFPSVLDPVSWASGSEVLVAGGPHPFSLIEQLPSKLEIGLAPPAA